MQGEGKIISKFEITAVSINPIKAGGGAFGAPPVVFCPSTLICDTITVKFFCLFINSNLKNFFVRLGYRAVKSLECVKKKSKDTDLLKSP